MGENNLLRSFYLAWPADMALDLGRSVPKTVGCGHGANSRPSLPQPLQ